MTPIEAADLFFEVRNQLARAANDRGRPILPAADAIHVAAALTAALIQTESTEYTGDIQSEAIREGCRGLYEAISSK